MNATPGGLDTDQGPPMAIPFQHFVVALGFLVAGVSGQVVLAITTLPGLDSVAHTHVLLVGWICLTIMGAMTQFVPVWSGVTLYSRRLARVQLWFVTVGLVGFVASLSALALEALPVFATLMLAGIWTFVYNVGRTLARARPFDVTERHFAFALGSFAVLAPLGFTLAVDFTTPVLDAVGPTRADVLAVHLTLGVFGAVTGTIVGALAQLATMFTQTETDALTRRLHTVEQLTFPVGVVALAAGRGIGSSSLAAVGGLGVLVGLLAVAVVLVRRLAGATVDPSPMTDRYWIVAASLVAWIAITVPAWLVDPLAPAARFGHPDGTALLLFGVFAFVVVGTCYHVIPFIVWIERYSDRLGLEPVPMIDDLYGDRLERVDFAATVLGVAGLVAAELFHLPTAVAAGAGTLAAIGFCLFVANVLRTVHHHVPGGLGGVLPHGVGSHDGAIGDDRSAAGGRNDPR